MSLLGTLYWKAVAPDPPCLWVCLVYLPCPVSRCSSALQAANTWEQLDTKMHWWILAQAVEAQSAEGHLYPRD